MGKTDDVIGRLDDIEARLSALESRPVTTTTPVAADDVDAFHRTAIVYILDKYFGAELVTLRALHSDAVANPDIAANTAAAQLDPSIGADVPETKVA